MAQLRLVWLQVLLAPVLLLIVVGFVLPWTAEDPGAGADTAVVVVGAVVLAAIGLGGAQWNRGRDYPCVPADELWRIFRTRVFLGIAIGDLPALLSFVAAFVYEEGWLYLVGVAISLISLAMIGPTRAHVERVDASLRAQGCRHALGETL